MRNKLKLFAFPLLALWLLGCGPTPEDCSEGTGDEDGDGFENCSDSDCRNVVFCDTGEDCGVPGDEDGDGASDCDDADCAGEAQCQGFCGDGSAGVGEQCDGNDLGGQTCGDFGFGGGVLGCDAGCFFDTTNCTQGGFCGDGVVDPATEQCDDGINGSATCSTNCTIIGGTCGNGSIDAGEQCDGQNLNGATCGSVNPNTPNGTLSCNGACTFNTSQCTGNTGPVCGNNVQEAGEQCDGTDLDGQSCVGFGFTGGTLSCNNGGAGVACTFNISGCSNAGGTEICTNGADDDGDGLADCDPAGQDAECDCANACTAPTVVTDPSTVQGDTTGHSQSRTGSCVGGASPDVAFQVTVAQTGTLDLVLNSAVDMGMYVRTACNQQAAEVPGACVDANGPGQETLSVAATAGQTLFIIVDGFQGSFGTFSLQVSSSPNQGGAEDCTNNTDDDGDGQVDCNDNDCTQACADSCSAPPGLTPDVTVQGSTVGHGDTRSGSCVGQGSPEVAYQVTIPQAGQLTVTLASQADLGVHIRTPTCNFVQGQTQELGCTDQNPGGQNETLTVNVAANSTLFVIVDGFTNQQGQPSAGAFTLQLNLQ